MNDLNFTAKERFSHLEDKIYRVSEIFKQISEQNQQLKEDIDNLKKKYHELEKRHSQIETLLNEVREEKDLIAEKVRSILLVLDSLENR